MVAMNQKSATAPRFPTAALPASGSEGLSHPAALTSTAARGPLTCVLTLKELWD